MTPNSPRHRLIRPAVFAQGDAGRTQGHGKERNKHAAKRTQITSIACVPCQQRKSKCDGGRPICQSCIAKGRPNCSYDFDGDQRRTSALKSRLGEMQQEVSQLRGIVHTLACSQDPAEVQSLAQEFEAARYGKVTADNFDSVLRGWDAPPKVEHVSDLDMRGSFVGYTTLSQGSPDVKHPSVDDSNGYGTGNVLDAGLPTPVTPASGDRWTFQPIVSEVMTADPMTRSMSMSAISSSGSASSHHTSEEPSSTDNYYTPHGTGSPVSRDGLLKRSPDSSPRKPYRYWFRRPKRSTYLQYYGDPPYSNEDSSVRPGAGFCCLSLPIHSMLPLQTMDPSALSRSYTDFCQEKRRLIEQGWPIDEVLGPSDVDAKSILMGTALDGNHSIANWAVAIVRAIDGMDTAEKLGTTLLHTRMMRWLISPSLESYEKLPECMRPTPVQLCVPHPAWIDFVAWPEIRDAFICRPEVLIGKDHLVPFTLSTSINWPHSVAEMTGFDSLTNEVRLSANFERYVEDINNWSLGPSVLSLFPILHDKAWFKEVNKGKGRSASSAESNNSADFAF